MNSGIRLKHKNISAVLIILSLIISMQSYFIPVTTSNAATAPALSRVKKTLWAGGSFKIKVQKNDAKKLMETKWSLNKNGQKYLVLSETGRNYAIVNSKTNISSGSITARLTAKVKYRAGKKTKTTKLSCEITVKAPTSDVTVEPTVTIAPSAAPTDPTPVPAPTPVTSQTPLPIATPTAIPATSLNVVSTYTNVYVDQYYHTIISLGFNKNYTQVQNYDALPRSTDVTNTDLGYWTVNVAKVARLYRIQNNKYYEIGIDCVTRPARTGSYDRLLLDLNTDRYEGSYLVCLYGFTAEGTNEPVVERRITLELTLKDIVSGLGRYHVVDHKTDINATHDVTLTIGGWSRKVVNQGQSLISQADLIKHVRVTDALGYPLTVKNIFMDSSTNEITIYVEGGTTSTWFSVSFDTVAPYMLWQLDSEGIYVARDNYRVTMVE